MSRWKKYIHRFSSLICVLSVGPTFMIYMVIIDPIPLIASSVLFFGSAVISVLSSDK